MPDEELTPLEAWNPDDVELENDDDEPSELEVLAVCEAVDVPGIVAALTMASTPTPAKAVIATPAVSRFRVCIAASLACTSASLALASMVRILDDRSELSLRAG